MSESNIVYSLDTTDVQTVAIDHLGRELTREELARVDELIAKHVDWYGSIVLALDDMNLSNRFK